MENRRIARATTWKFAGVSTRSGGFRYPSLALCAVLAWACSGKVRALNEAGSAGASGAETGGLPGTGGNGETGGVRATGGTRASGGVSAGGATASGGVAVSGGSGAVPATGGSGTAAAGSTASGGCSSSLGTGCLNGAVCADDPDGCDPRLADDCSGKCFQPLRNPVCAGLGGGIPCPDELACVPNPRDYRGTDPTGICVGKGLLNSCGEIKACHEDFLCLGGALPVDGPGHCAPDGVACVGPITCDIAELVACPPGYVHSNIEACTGPCVPIDTCGCTGDSDCPASSVCDRLTRRCAELPGRQWQPAARCLQPFDPGTCDANFAVFAFVDGACVERSFGGCDGNENRFYTLEECLSSCEGRPFPNSCPDGRTPEVACLECGPAGGCSKSFSVCAKACAANADCAGGNLSCAQGICQMVGCI